MYVFFICIKIHTWPIQCTAVGYFMNLKSKLSYSLPKWYILFVVLNALSHSSISNKPSYFSSLFFFMKCHCISYNCSRYPALKYIHWQVTYNIGVSLIKFIFAGNSIKSSFRRKRHLSSGDQSTNTTLNTSNGGLLCWTFHCRFVTIPIHYTVIRQPVFDKERGHVINPPIHPQIRASDNPALGC